MKLLLIITFFLASLISAKAQTSDSYYLNGIKHSKEELETRTWIVEKIIKWHENRNNMLDDPYISRPIQNCCDSAIWANGFYTYHSLCFFNKSEEQFYQIRFRFVTSIQIFPFTYNKNALDIRFNGIDDKGNNMSDREYTLRWDAVLEPNFIERMKKAVEVLNTEIANRINANRPAEKY